MPHDNWEQIHYHELPDWIKKIVKPGQRINRTWTRIFSGKLYDYEVRYTVHQDIVSISYWRAPHITKPVTYPKTGSLAIIFLLFLLSAWVSFVVLDQIPPSNSIQSYTGSPQANMSEMPELYSTPVQSDNVTPTSEVRPDSEDQQSPKTSSYPYFTENSRKFISFTTYAGLSGYFSEERHKSLFGSETDVVLERLLNDYQDEYLQPFIETIRKRSSNPDDHAKIAISLVQHMPYNANKPYHDTGEWFFPYETLYRNGGSSADKSLLTAYLLKELGYETVLFEYPGRMAVGVKCSPDYDFYDTGFAFIETTEPTIITYVPVAYGGVFSVSGTMRIIRLDEGKRVLDVSTEYGDALRLKELERMGGVLNQTQFTEWQKISNQYDLQ